MPMYIGIDGEDVPVAFPYMEHMAYGMLEKSNDEGQGDDRLNLLVSTRQNPCQPH